MPKTPKKELEEFLTSKPVWARKVLQVDYESLTSEENSDWALHQNDEYEWRKEFERILVQMPVKWNVYCKAFSKHLAVTQKYEKRLLAPKSRRGAPRKDGLAAEASALQQRGLKFPQIAERLSKKYGETVSSEAIRKRIKRYADGATPRV